MIKMMMSIVLIIILTILNINVYFVKANLMDFKYFAGKPWSIMKIILKYLKNILRYNVSNVIFSY